MMEQVELFHHTVLVNITPLIMKHKRKVVGTYSVNIPQIFVGTYNNTPHLDNTLALLKLVS